MQDEHIPSGNPITEVAEFFKRIDYERLISSAGDGLEFIKKKAAGGTEETTRIMLELYYVMMSDKTSRFTKLIIATALGYQFLPNDFMTRDKYGVLGYLDNATALYLAYRKVKKNVTPEIEAKVNETIEGWKKSASEFTIMKPAEDAPATEAEPQDNQ